MVVSTTYSLSTGSGDPPQTFNRLRCRDDIPLQSFNDLSSRQNVPEEHLEGFNRRYGCQNGLTTALPTLCSNVNCFAEYLHTFNRVCGSLNMYDGPPQVFNTLHGS